jgi:hypothetical protein
MAMVKTPVVSNRPVAPRAFSGETSGANRKRHSETKMAAKPRDMATLRMEWPVSPRIVREHFWRHARRFKMGQTA